jgi:hypothetical protein
MRRIGAVLVVAAIVLLGARGATAGNYAQESLDRTFRIEFEATAAGTPRVISGYVYNLYGGMAADRMQLSIERLDAAGNVIGTSSTWVLGGVPPGSRAYFTARVEPAASYRVQVLAFDWVGRGV